MFYGNKLPIEQRTSYTLFDKDKLPVFSGYVDIEFDLKISQSDTFGYLLHLVDPENHDAYSLTYSYVNNKTSIFKFNTEGKKNHIAITMPNDSIISRWLRVKLHIDFLSGKSRMSIGSQSTNGDIGLMKQLQQVQPMFIFGRRKHLVDVPAFSIRELKVLGKGQDYSFLLNESKGNLVHDSEGKIRGTVINPYWLINDSYHWKQVTTFISSVSMGSKFNVEAQEIQFITPDSFFTYQVGTKKSQKRPYANEMPVKMQLGTNFINGATGNICAYEINNLPIGSITMATLDRSTLMWQPLGKAFTKVQLHHHNGFWDKDNNRYLVFGGFGNRLYSNTFLTYNEPEDRWDTLHFKGDNITPRFYSSMVSSGKGNYLYIYGGVGNESGDQSIGHNYYNDLYGVDLKRRTIKKYWSHPNEENRVPSEQMILSEDGKSLYTIRYAEYIKSTYLELYRMSVENGDMEQLGDSIPFISGSIKSTVSLFHNPVLNEFYCVTQEVDEHTKQVKAVIYTLAAPPVSNAEMEYYSMEEGEMGTLRWIFSSLALVVFILGGIVFVYVLRKKRETRNDNYKTTTNVSSDIYLQKSKNRDEEEISGSTSVSPLVKRQAECNKIYVYGRFTIYGRNGRDITYLFSKKLKYIFLYILLDSAEKGEGVNSSSLNEIFWPDKSEDKAKNLKGVTISNLRKVLSELDGIKLVYERGVFKISIDKSICYCDYFCLHDHLTTHPQSCKSFLNIWERGRLLENEEDSLYDKYKQHSEDVIFSLLPKDLPIYYRQNEFSYVLRICFIILRRDPLSEKALSYCVRSYKKLNDFASLSKIYSTFIIEYRKSMGEDYKKTIEQLLLEDKNV
ncbi:hypothetical protein [Bacteroides sp.]|uniref:hypothetical protein n=1 Tax=Bacteroides sp. TaxID=29523 RepID=UPI002616403B|nr:hypothetical protein [Bacteroides sp.]MDD3036569.1 hypothetical protein [Bacteroides sp.]